MESIEHQDPEMLMNKLNAKRKKYKDLKAYVQLLEEKIQNLEDELTQVKNTKKRPRVTKRTQEQTPKEGKITKAQEACVENILCITQEGEVQQFISKETTGFEWCENENQLNDLQKLSVLVIKCMENVTDAKGINYVDSMLKYLYVNSKTELVKLFAPVKTKTTEYIDGSADEVVEKLVSIMKNEIKVI